MKPVLTKILSVLILTISVEPASAQLAKYSCRPLFKKSMVRELRIRLEVIPQDDGTACDVFKVTYENSSLHFKSNSLPFCGSFGLTPFIDIRGLPESENEADIFLGFSNGKSLEQYALLSKSLQIGLLANQPAPFGYLEERPIQKIRDSNKWKCHLVDAN